MNPYDAVQIVRGDLPTEVAAVFGSSRRIAWDVETTGLDWRRERLATCQLFAKGVGPVIVSLDGGRPTQLAALLEDPAVEKVFHHAPFDLRFLVHAWDIQPTSIRCTKVASKLLAPDAPNESHSLQQLVAHHLGITLAKGPVRTSDWTAEVLTAGQIDYAVGDVLHLLALVDILKAALDEVQLSQLYDDCCAFLPGRVRLELGSYPDVFGY